MSKEGLVTSIKTETAKHNNEMRMGVGWLGKEYIERQEETAQGDRSGDEQKYIHDGVYSHVRKLSFTVCPRWK